ncbi:MAG: right-handed parallel beta-helix repeat-containing protein [Candidatus Marinimicrobia bacterium]|nr:right-handed parallel beta-helix repeat-containing protein [Candidatus Neomarinimicrobiota bacterium]
MNRILGTISLILVVAFLSTINLFAQTTVEIGSAGFTMIENVEGPSNGQQYFSIADRSNTFLDGSENYYSVSMKTPHTDDCFGLKIKGIYTENDTIRRVAFTHCGDGIYCRGWGGGGGLIDDCSFIENDNWGIRFGNIPNLDIEIRNCLFRDNNNGGISLKSVENLWVHDNVFMAYTDTSLTGILLAGHESYGPSRDNVIERNFFTQQEDYGIALENGAVNNIIRGNKFFNDPIRVDNADSNLFVGNFIKDCEVAIRITGCIGNVFEKDTVENSTTDVSLGSAAEVTFVGTIFDSAKVVFSDAESKLTVKWYLDVKIVGSGDAAVEGAEVKILDINDNQVVIDITDSEGKIATQQLSDYIIDSTSVTTFNPYTLVVEKDSIKTVKFNLTENVSAKYNIVTGELTGVESAELEAIGNEYVSVLSSFALKQNYPNPFNPGTRISYQLPENCEVCLRIYNLHGQLVKTLLMNEFQTQGYKSIHWDGRDGSGNSCASGIYFYSLVAGDFRQTKRMILIR